MKYLALYNTYSMRAAALLAVVVAASVFAYGACMLLAVAHAAEIRSAESAIHTLSSRASALESAYLAENALLTEERAHALGFVEPTEQFVVYAAPDTLSLNR